MNDGFAYLDILFFAMVAGFIALRLRGVLGKKTGNERRRTEEFTPPAKQSAPTNVIPLPERGREAESEPAVAGPSGVADIRRADPSFDISSFLQGSRGAFGMIVEAFAQGDKKSLRPLLADSVYNDFAAAIDGRASSGDTQHSELVAIRAADLDSATLVGRIARVTVRFVSDQVTVMRDPAGEVIHDENAAPAEVVDLWSFERDTRSRDPNWKLVETRSPT